MLLCTDFSLVVVSWGYSLELRCRAGGVLLLVVVDSPVAEHRLWELLQASVVAAPRLSNCGTWA